MANVREPGACESCNRPLPQQSGSGRRRRYCDATCRSAARRQRDSVNGGLTNNERKAIADNVLDAVRQAQAQAAAAEKALAAAVSQAREHRHTWAEIGQELSVSRQAAFQRFGRPLDPRTGVPMEPAVTDAADRALKNLFSRS